jgi:hypothetical protein
VSERRGDDFKQRGGEESGRWLRVENAFALMTGAFEKLDAALARLDPLDQSPDTLPPNIRAYRGTAPARRR